VQEDSKISWSSQKNVAYLSWLKSIALRCSSIVLNNLTIKIIYSTQFLTIFEGANTRQCMLYRLQRHHSVKLMRIIRLLITEKAGIVGIFYDGFIL